jgi:hypothetical protein
VGFMEVQDWPANVQLPRGKYYYIARAHQC